MRPELSKIKGTIANHFTQNSSKLWGCGNDVEKMRKMALQLLEDPTLTDKKAVLEAKQSLSKAKPSSFCSTLVTYMTGMKV